MPAVSVQRVGSLSELAIGSMRQVRVGERRLLLVRTSRGVSALDHDCPHQGYGLTQGLLDADTGLLTCAWHNWKFRVTDGRCVLGEEDVPAHPVRLDGDDILVELAEPTPAEERARLLPSLRRGLEGTYTGQIARDVVRLLRAQADPAEVVWEGVAFGAPRGEFGWGHALAVAADAVELLAAGDLAGDERAYPVVNALVGLAESERRRPARPQPAPDRDVPADAAAAGTLFRERVEAEDTAGAEALVLGALRRGIPAEDLRPWFVGATSDHHLSFGHAAIYTQKAFSLLDHLGPDRAATVLAPLAHGVTLGTREDLLPYYREAAARVRGLDVGKLAAAPGREETGWVDEGGDLRRLLLDGAEAPVGAAADAVVAGAGVEGLLDVVVLAASERLLRHDPSEDAAPTDFNWLHITHVLTYADAVRWAWRAEPGPDAARLALWTVLFAHDSGRAERRRRERGWTPTLHAERADADAADAGGAPTTGAGLRAAVETGRADEAVGLALALPAETAGAALERAALSDLAGSFIVSAHLVKTARAARRESGIVGSTLPLAAAARFCASPRVERFVGSATTEAIHLAERGTPLPR